MDKKMKKIIIIVLLFFMTFCKKQIINKNSGKYICYCDQPVGSKDTLTFNFFPSPDGENNLYEGEIKDRYNYVYLKSNGTFSCPNPNWRYKGKFKTQNKIEIEMLDYGQICNGYKIN